MMDLPALAAQERKADDPADLLFIGEAIGPRLAHRAVQSCRLLLEK